MEWWGYLILAVIGGGFLGVGVLWIARKFKGNIEIKLKHSSMIPGDKMGGDINITFRKAMQSNSLDAVLIIQEKIQARRNGNNETRTEEIYRDTVHVADGLSYSAGERVSYPFEITVPNIGSSTQAQSSMGGVTGTLLNAAASYIGDRTEYIWELEARLDAPGLDLVTSKKLNPQSIGSTSMRTENSFSINAS